MNVVPLVQAPGLAVNVLPTCALPPIVGFAVVSTPRPTAAVSTDVVVTSG